MLCTLHYLQTLLITCWDSLGKWGITDIASIQTSESYQIPSRAQHALFLLRIIRICPFIVISHQLFHNFSPNFLDLPLSVESCSHCGDQQRVISVHLIATALTHSGHFHRMKPTWYWLYQFQEIHPTISCVRDKNQIQSVRRVIDDLETLMMLTFTENGSR